MAFSRKDNASQVDFAHQKEKIKIAACPTCFELAQKVNTEKYEIIRTASTAESLALLESKKVDMIMAGRTLKPSEPRMDHLLVKDGYSFLSDQEVFIYITELKNYDVYTDLNIETLQNIFPVQNIKQVDNIYDYLDQSIVITFWENTDYSRSQIVHLLKDNGDRVELSRRPTIYCPNICSEEAQELALLLK